MFHLFRSEGIINLIELKYCILVCLVCCLISLLGSYFHIHIAWFSLNFISKYKSIGVYHILVLFSLGSLSWSSHQFHISLPLNCLLDSGIDLYLLPSAEELLVIKMFSLYMYGFVFSLYYYLFIFTILLSFRSGSLFLLLNASN